MACHASAGGAKSTFHRTRKRWQIQFERLGGMAYVVRLCVRGLHAVPAVCSLPHRWHLACCILQFVAVRPADSERRRQGTPEQPRRGCTADVRCGPPACRRQHAAYNVRHATRSTTACSMRPSAVFHAARQAGDDDADGRACILRARGAGKPGTLCKARVLRVPPREYSG
jgi:hypothetical protein